MSEQQSGMGENPYAPPRFIAENKPTPANRPARGRVTGFSQGVAVADLIFCILRVPFALLGVVAIVAVVGIRPLHLAIVIEMLTNLGICGFGISGNILLLRRRAEGVPLAWTAFAFVLLNVLCSIWQVNLIVYAMRGPAEKTGIVLGASILLAARFVLNVIYYAAVLRKVRREAPST